MKLSAQTIAIPLVRIFNQSIKSGRLPEDFKTAKIIPIPKIKNSQELNTFRPISLLSTISKVLERAVHSQLMNYLNKENLMNERQSGFRSKHSTSTCLTEICDMLYDNLDKGRYTGAVFLDLKKAFDIIPHDLLIKKLSYFGIEGIELAWFKSYLLGRTQCVSYKGTLSNFLPVRSGVPQGSILGPLLFCLFINDICNLPLHPSTKISLYADDTTVFSSGYGVQSVQNTLQKDIQTLCTWFNENGLVVNIDKTKTMLFSSRAKKNTLDFKIYMDDKQLENVSKFKYLGVLINKNLDWSFHVNDMIRKIMNSIICVRRIKNCLTKRILRNLYFNLILPHIDYCSTVWGSLTKKDLIRLQRCQNKYCRLALDADYYTSSKRMLNKLNIQSIKKRLDYNYSVLMYKILNGLAPAYLNQIFPKNPNPYTTRSASLSQLYLSKPRTELKKRSFSYTASKLYNKLPIPLKCSTSLDIFKRRLSRSLISSL